MKFLNLIVLSFLAIILFSCEKNKEIDPIQSEYRIKEKTTHYSYGQMSKDVYTYEGERLIRKTSLSQDDKQNLVEMRKSEYLFDGNDVTCTNFSKETEIWKENSKLVYNFDDDLLLDMTFINNIDGLWLTDEKNVILYAGTYPISVKSYDYQSGNGSLRLVHTIEYTYENHILKEAIRYKVDEYANRSAWYKEVFSYSGDKLMGWTAYTTSQDADNWRETAKVEHSYSEEKIIESKIYEWDHEQDNWSMAPFVKTYSYNEHGYVEQEFLDADQSSFVFVYEPGHGNAQLFEYLPHDLIYNFPVIK